MQDEDIDFSDLSEIPPEKFALGKAKPDEVADIIGRPDLDADGIGNTRVPHRS